MSREAPLLPVSDAREAALFFVIGALCFLAALSALVTRATYTAAQSWGDQVEGSITIIVEDADRRSVETFAEDIEAIASVVEARVLSRSEMSELLEPSFGPGGLPDGLPLPLLIAVEADLGTADPTEAIRGLASKSGLDAEVSAHSSYANSIRDALGIIRIVALGTVMLLAATAIAVIAFATHAALLARRDIVDVLHLSGAEDRYISGLFERRFWLLALKAGIAGAAAALMVSQLIAISLPKSETATYLLPRLSPDYVDLVILVITPIIAAIAARLAAHLTVMRSLKETL